MGKRTSGRAKGKGSFTYQIRKKAYVYKIGYPRLTNEGKAKIIKLFHSVAHSAPIAKIRIGKEEFYSPAADKVYEGQEIEIGGKQVLNGNILKLKDIPQGTVIFNIESVPGNGGKYLRSSGCSAIVGIKEKDSVEIIIRRRKIIINENCRATIGVVAGEGRMSKPLVKAGKQFFRMQARGRKWHRTSAIKTNAVDHPFGSGRGKRIKSKIAKRNAPPGAKVGHIRPKRTGHIK
jgi:large subunit ribosomal protein L2